MLPRGGTVARSRECRLPPAAARPSLLLHPNLPALGCRRVLRSQIVNCTWAFLWMKMSCEHPRHVQHSHSWRRATAHCFRTGWLLACACQWTGSAEEESEPPPHRCHCLLPASGSVAMSRLRHAAGLRALRGHRTHHCDVWQCNR